MIVEENIAAPVPLWTRIAAGAGVVWYAFGLLQMWLGLTLDVDTAIASGEMTAAHAAAVSATPGFVWGLFALASAAGLLGALLMVFARSMAFHCFAVSFGAALAYYAWSYVFAGTASARPAEEAVITVVVVAVTGAMLWLARKT